METDGEARSGEGAAAKDRKSRLEKLQIKESDIAPRSLGKEDETRTQKPFIGTLWVNESHPAELGQQPEASLAWWRGNPPCEA